jgi:hypothetical protein
MLTLREQEAIRVLEAAMRVSSRGLDAVNLAAEFKLYRMQLLNVMRHFGKKRPTYKPAESPPQ